MIRPTAPKASPAPHLTNVDCSLWMSSLVGRPGGTVSSFVSSPVSLFAMRVTSSRKPFRASGCRSETAALFDHVQALYPDAVFGMAWLVRALMLGLVGVAGLSGCQRKSAPPAPTVGAADSRANASVDVSAQDKAGAASPVAPSPAPTTPAADARVQPGFSSSSSRVGEPFDVTIDVDAAVPVAKMEVRLTYDAASIRLRAAEEVDYSIDPYSGKRGRFRVVQWADDGATLTINNVRPSQVERRCGLRSSKRSPPAAPR